MKETEIVVLLCLFSWSIVAHAILDKDIIDNAEVPRVKVKVFRGPSKEQDGKEFATWGFWIRQPAEVDHQSFSDSKSTIDAMFQGKRKQI